MKFTRAASLMLQAAFVLGLASVIVLIAADALGIGRNLAGSGSARTHRHAAAHPAKPAVQPRPAPVMAAGHGQLELEGVTIPAVGVLVTSVPAGGAAAQAGIEPGDVITSIDEHRVSGRSAMRSILESFSAGEEVMLGVFRVGSELLLQATLGP